MSSLFREKLHMKGVYGFKLGPLRTWEADSQLINSRRPESSLQAQICPLSCDYAGGLCCLGTDGFPQSFWGKEVEEMQEAAADEDSLQSLTARVDSRSEDG